MQPPHLFVALVQRSLRLGRLVCPRALQRRPARDLLAVVLLLPASLQLLLVERLAQLHRAPLVLPQLFHLLPQHRVLPLQLQGGGVLRLLC